MEQKFRFIYKNQKPLLIKALGFLIILIALLRIRETPIFSLIMGLFSTGIFVYQRGVDINFEERKFRYFTSFGPQVYGKWENVDPVEYISVFAANYSSSVSGISTTKVTSSQILIEVNLVKSKKNLVNVFLTKDKDEAFEIALELAKKLSLKIYDATSRDRKWITTDISSLAE
jgi:hypothetical protein